MGGSKALGLLPPRRASREGSPRDPSAGALLVRSNRPFRQTRKIAQPGLLRQPPRFRSGRSAGAPRPRSSCGPAHRRSPGRAGASASFGPTLARFARLRGGRTPISPEFRVVSPCLDRWRSHIFAGLRTILLLRHAAKDPSRFPTCCEASAERRSSPTAVPITSSNEHESIPSTKPSFRRTPCQNPRRAAA
jgi:hypothetical protein